VDWPASAFWTELADVHPEAVILLSTRADSGAWWKSASDTIFLAMAQAVPPEMADWHHMVVSLLENRFTLGWREEDAARLAYDRHNADVRATAPADRLVEWQPGD